MNPPLIARDGMEESFFTEKKCKVWSNIDNESFYEDISLETFKTNSILGGLEQGGDLDLICEYIFNANSILEVGAGYGRVLNYLIKHGFIGNLAAIERSKKCSTLLNKQFGDRVAIFNINLSQFEIKNKFDLILWMFSGISDFAKDEQILMLKRLTKHLTKKGIIILDTFLHSIKPANAVIAERQNYIITADNKTLYGYIPSSNEIDDYAGKLGFKTIQHLGYETITKSKRILHILSL